MTTVHFNRQRARQLHRRNASVLFLVPLIVFAAVALSAFGYVAYVLWPRWSAPRLDAPPLPITVAGVAFNLPPPAIRVAAQRRAGAQERVDLVFLWPSLQPPDPESKPSALHTEPVARVFMTIAAAGDTLAPADRALTIYPRHTAAEPLRGPGGWPSSRSETARLMQARTWSMSPEQRVFSCAAPAGRVPCLLPASMTVVSTRPTSWCASRAIGSTTGAWLPRRSTG
jgi:hypothetical protein